MSTFKVGDKVTLSKEGRSNLSRYFVNGDYTLSDHYSRQPYYEVSICYGHIGVWHDNIQNSGWLALDAGWDLYHGFEYEYI